MGSKLRAPNYFAVSKGKFAQPPRREWKNFRVQGDRRAVCGGGNAAIDDPRRVAETSAPAIDQYSDLKDCDASGRRLTDTVSFRGERLVKPPNPFYCIP